MDGSDLSTDPRLQLQEAIQKIREAVQALRESVVQAVKRRNDLDKELSALTVIIRDLDAKVQLAEANRYATAAAALREERQDREAERERLVVLFAEAEAIAESAKLRLPEEEGRLLRQANELKAQFAQAISNAIDVSSPGGFGSEADILFTRAAEKMQNLAREVVARQEAVSRPSSPAPDVVSPEQVAERMLGDLEARLNLTVPLSAPPPLTIAEVAPSPPVEDLSPAPAVGASGSAPAVEELPAPPVVEALISEPVLEAAAPSAEPLSAIVQKDATAAAEPATTEFPPADQSVGDDMSFEVVQRKDVESVWAANGETQKPEATVKNAQAPVQAATVIVATKAKGELAGMEPTQRVRVAAIGTGGIFRGAHLPAYPEIPQAKLVAFCDPDKDAQKQVYKRYQALVEENIKKATEKNDTDAVERLQRDLEEIQIFDDISQVIEKVKPDLVDICTQPFLHAPLSIQALDAGINVMCEKPIARSWLETKRLAAAVKRSGKFYQHNENWLFDPPYYTAQKLIRSGAIGEPILMFLATAHGGPEGNPKFWNPEFGGGGSLLDNGIHAIGAAWYMTGLDRRPTLVKAAEPFGMSIRMPDRLIDGRFTKVTVEDDAHILIRFENTDSGAWTTAHVEGSWSHRDSPETAIIGTTGKIVFARENDRSYAVVFDSYDKESRRLQLSGPHSSFYGEILNMVESVRNNVPSISTNEFGADCSAIVGASYLSQRDGKRAVTLDEFKVFANGIEARYPNDPTGADNALVEALLSAVRK